MSFNAVIVFTVISSVRAQNAPLCARGGGCVIRLTKVCAEEVVVAAGQMAGTAFVS